MQINDIIWLDEVRNKIEIKHRVSVNEVEEVLSIKPKFCRAQTGKFKGEDLYYAYGKTDSGRYLLVVFIYKKSKEALIITSRDMDVKERRRYGRSNR